jgi:monofunctional glycosyltransferase
LKEHWAVDERARDEERTASGASCGADPAASAAQPSLRWEGNALGADEKAAAPHADVPPLLPRAASGGAGAVAALTTEAKWGASELLASSPRQLDGAAGEPDGLPIKAGTPAQIAAKPLDTHATLAIELTSEPAASAEPAPEETASADVAASEPAATQVEPAADDAPAVAEPPGALPAPAQALAGAPPRAPEAGLEPASAENIAQANGGSHTFAAVAQSARSEAAWPTQADVETSPADTRDEPAPQTGPAIEDRLATSAAHTGVAERIPEVLPSPPALSPSVTPALGPVEIEPVRIRETDATRSSAAVAPQSQAVPAALRPPTNPALHPQTPAKPELIGVAPAIAASAPTIPAPSPTPARGLPLPSRDGRGVEQRHLHLLLGAGLALLIGVGGLLLVLLLLYRWVDPPASTLMLSQRFAGTPTTQRWVLLERMSPNLVAAVIASEDGHFCRHHGVDWGELREAIESAGDGLARGGSTISMQVVKNLFLWPSRSYVRKAIEIPLAYSIEALWSKRRILEIYLNIAEWGPGIFGAEAAARYHFRKPALLLTSREAALLAVSLPNPFERQAGRPGPGTLRLADNLLLRMRAAQANTACVRMPPYGG